MTKVQHYATECKELSLDELLAVAFDVSTSDRYASYINGILAQVKLIAEDIGRAMESFYYVLDLKTSKVTVWENYYSQLNLI